MASQGTHLSGVRLIYIIIYAATLVGDWWLPAGINDIHCKLNPELLACTASALITELISCAHACTCAMGLSNQFCLFVHQSVCLSAHLSVCQSVVSQSVSLSVCLSCGKNVEISAFTGSNMQLLYTIITWQSTKSKQNNNKKIICEPLFYLTSQF